MKIKLWATGSFTGTRGCDIANCRVLCTNPIASGSERSEEWRAKYLRINVLLHIVRII